MLNNMHPALHLHVIFIIKLHIGALSDRWVHENILLTCLTAVLLYCTHELLWIWGDFRPLYIYLLFHRCEMWNLVIWTITLSYKNEFNLTLIQIKSLIINNSAVVFSLNTDYYTWLRPHIIRWAMLGCKICELKGQKRNIFKQVERWKMACG